MKKTLILYELNEVPEKVIREYIKIRPHSYLAKLISKSEFLLTFTDDVGELHPWSTWPTVHRGVPNFIHNIRFINQDLTCAKKYPPIWEVLASMGISIGIFGSLQSYPPLKGKNFKFYVPDTFAPNKTCYPKYLSDFQEFNLHLAGANKAIQKKIDLRAIILFCRLIFLRMISPKTLFISISQVIKESYNPKFKSRRSLIQPHFGFDVYLKELKKHNPSFTTFFTNHVAGMMHRYWKDLFPKDFKLKNSKKAFHSNSILKAMDIADEQIGQLYKYSKFNDANLWILSSMGQKAIDRGNNNSELFLENFSDLLNSLKLEKEKYKLLPAMQPDICIKCHDIQSLKNLEEASNYLVDLNGEIILKKRYNPNGLNLNLSIQNSESAKSEKLVKFKNNNPQKLDEYGLKIIYRDIGTGYHSPEGILIAFGPEKDIIKNLKISKNKFLKTTEIYGLILKIFR